MVGQCIKEIRKTLKMEKKNRVGNRRVHFRPSPERTRANESVKSGLLIVSTLSKFTIICNLQHRELVKVNLISY